jgi:transposase-like protein
LGKEDKNMSSGFKKVAPEVKAEILEKVKLGEKVVDVAKQYGIYHKTIYNWLSNKVNQTNEQLEISKLKRHNEELLQMVGELTLEINKLKKNILKN